MPDYRKTHKTNKGNQYRFNEEFAEEVTKKNNKQAVSNNPRGRIKK